MPPATISLVLSVLLTSQAPKGEPNWQKITSKGGSFSIMVPGRARQAFQSQTSPAGPVETRQVVCEAKGGVLFIATETKLPAPQADQEKTYFGAIRESAKTPGRALQKEQVGTHHGMRMCYFRIASTAADGQPQVEQSRIILGDPMHVYSLEVLAPKGVDVNQDVNRFFESFDRVEPTPGKVAANPKPSAKGAAAAKGAEPAAVPWKLFTPPGKGFAISMPGEPKHETQGPADNSMKIDTYEVDLGDRNFNALAYEMASPTEPDALAKSLEEGCKALVATVKGAVAELKPVKDSGLEGREVRFTFNRPDNGEPAVGRARTFGTGNWTYLFVFTGPEGMADKDEVRKFFNSFRVVKPKVADEAKPKAKAKGRP